MMQQNLDQTVVHRPRMELTQGRLIRKGWRIAAAGLAAGGVAVLAWPSLPVTGAVLGVACLGGVLWGRREIHRRATETAQLRAEVEALRTRHAALVEQEAVLDSAFQYAAIGKALVGLDGRWLKVNPVLCRMTGYPEAELLRTDFQAITHPEDLNADVDQVQRILARQIDHYQMEKRYFHKEGHLIWVLLSVSLVCDQAGEPRYFVAEIQDISERKAMEAELRRTRDAAEAATRAKAEFLANMSHEIRTPMNGVLGMTDLALASSDPEEQREYLRIVRTSGVHMLAILNDILDFSKIEAGKMVLETAPFPVRENLEQLLTPLAHQAAAKGLTLNLEVAPDVPERVVGDVVRLGQVVVNLVGNALKFTARGEVRITIDRLPAPGETCLRYRISDTGIGIPAERQAAIFEAFGQAASDTNRKYGGTGLGLTISRRLVELMGGEITVTSRPGEGSTFTFTVRLGKAPAPRPAAAPAAGSLAPATGHSLRILVTEDDATNQLLARRILEKCGHSVALASSGREALNLLENEAFDLVLMDVQMPGMSGLDTTRCIREREQGTDRHIPIIAATACAMAEDRDRCLDAGMDGYITKPIRTPELLNELETIRAAKALTLR